MVNLSSLYGKCMQSRQKEKQRLIYKAILPTRTTVKTGEKEGGIQLTLGGYQRGGGGRLWLGGGVCADA